MLRYWALLGLLLSGCLLANPISNPQFTPEQNYFLQVAFGNEFSPSDQHLKKWNQPMRVFVNNPPAELSSELNRIIAELNGLLIPHHRLERVNTATQANFVVVLGGAQDYAALNPLAATQATSNWGLFWVWWREYQIHAGDMYVDILRTRTLDEQKHLLREELTQALGLMNDSWQEPQSIFYQGWTSTTEYTALDRSVIQMLYSPRLKAGMTPQDVLEVWQKP